MWSKKNLIEYIEIVINKTGEMWKDTKTVQLYVNQERVAQMLPGELKDLNLIGLVPYNFRQTSHLIVTLAISLYLFIGINRVYATIVHTLLILIGFSIQF